MVERLLPRQERTESISVSGIRSFIKCIEFYFDKTYSKNKLPPLGRSKGIRYLLFHELAKALMNNEIRKEFEDVVKSDLLKQLSREKDFDLKNIMLNLMKDIENAQNIKNN
jgi:hypothetical protein